ncbi:hypothetical protein BJ508DRAFT_416898 [Ascobolus immersus RN42]|uniref:Dienelactone hydrolase domain-containing protein n=1 Tax=Ascobolus immersus RN42 TaxID=1160509 RepID=A0A3N4I7I1_ASCIM|nr:hypothetical protein BJ508DRAFT_416898 [Ascobolus immersus RN42]
MKFLLALTALAALPLSSLCALENWSGRSVYVAYPGKSSAKKPPKNPQTILLLTDIFGHLSPPAQALANKISKSGNFLVVMPDLFNGDPIPFPPPATGLDPAWIAQHTEPLVDPRITEVVNNINKKYKPRSIGGSGYCFGGKYVFRALAKGEVSVIFSAHPGLLSLEEIQAGAGKGPIQFALADEDPAFGTAARIDAEAVLRNSSMPWTSTVYDGPGAGIAHGFAVRPTVPGEKYSEWALNKATDDAVSWFKLWLN